MSIDTKIGIQYPVDVTNLVIFTCVQVTETRIHMHYHTQLAWLEKGIGCCSTVATHISQGMHPEFMIIKSWKNLFSDFWIAILGFLSISVWQSRGLLLQLFRAQHVPLRLHVVQR